MKQKTKQKLVSYFFVCAFQLIWLTLGAPFAQAQVSCNPSNNIASQNNSDPTDCGTANQTCGIQGTCVAIGNGTVGSGSGGPNCTGTSDVAGCSCTSVGSQANCQAGLICTSGANGAICAQNNPSSGTGSGSGSSVGSPCTTNADCGSSGLTCVGNVGNETCQSSAVGNGSSVGTSSACPAGLTAGPAGTCLPPNNCSGGLCNANSLTDVLLYITKFLLFFAGTVAVIMLILGGYWLITSGGNEEQAEKGKKTITNFVLGLVVILMAYAIVTIIGNTVTDNAFVNPNSGPSNSPTTNGSSNVLQ